MTLTLQLSIWLVVSFVGWFASLILSYRTYGRLILFRTLLMGVDLIDATTNLLVFNGIGLIAWSLFLSIGLIAVFDTNNSPAVGQTVIGQAIVALLLSAIALNMAKTVFSVMVDVQQERRARHALLVQTTRPTPVP